MDTIAISGTIRESVGTKHAKLDRSQGNVPCVLYGQNNVTHFTIKVLDVRPMVYTPDFKLAELDIAGTKTKAILKDLQFHPVTDELLHVDFLSLQDGHPVKIEVPIVFKGESPGVKGGGKLVSQMRKVKIKTTPEHLVDKLQIDISELELGSAVRVKQIEASDGIEVMSPPNTPVATVEIPRALKSAATAEAKEAKNAPTEADAGSEAV